VRKGTSTEAAARHEVTTIDGREHHGQMSWDRILPTAAVLAVVEGLILGYVFSGVFAGAGLSAQYWALMAAIVGFGVLVGAIAVDRIARNWLSRSDVALAGLIVGPLIGLLIGYLCQPVGRPV